MTTTDNNVTPNMTPAEGAHLLAKPEEGQQAAAVDEHAARLLSDPSTPLGQAYAKAFSDTAAAQVRELHTHDPLPEPDRTSGGPHPDPFLAARGWHVNQHGIYTRRAEPQPEPLLERELEAGS